MRASSRLSVLFALALSVPASAQTGLQVQPARGEAVLPSSADGSLLPEAAAIIIYDDGEADTTVSGASSFDTFELMMRFDSILGTDVTLGGVDVCMQQSGSDSKSATRSSCGPRTAPAVRPAPSSPTMPR